MYHRCTPGFDILFQLFPCNDREVCREAKDAGESKVAQHPWEWNMEDAAQTEPQARRETRQRDQHGKQLAKEEHSSSNGDAIRSVEKHRRHVSSPLRTGIDVGDEKQEAC